MQHKISGGRSRHLAASGGRPPGVSNVGLIYAAARLYYQADMSQSAIGERLQVSHSTVSRLLRRARDLEIVTIEVRQPPTAALLSEELATSLGLRSVEVISLADSYALSAVAAPVARIVRQQRLKGGAVLAMGWGQMVWEVVQSGLPRLPGALIVPTIGGMNESAPYFQVNEIVRKAASITGGAARFIHAPAMPSESLRRSLLTHPEILSAVSLWDRISVAIVGIGAAPMALAEYGPNHVPRQGGYLDSAVGDVSSHYFDLEGQPIPYPGEELLVAVSREQLRRAGLAIGVAVGAQKAASIVGAARAGLIHALVTEETTAREVLRLAHAMEAPMAAKH